MPCLVHISGKAIPRHVKCNLRICAIFRCEAPLYETLVCFVLLRSYNSCISGRVIPRHVNCAIVIYLGAELFYMRHCLFYVLLRSNHRYSTIDANFFSLIFQNNIFFFFFSSFTKIIVLKFLTL